MLQLTENLKDGIYFFDLILPFNGRSAIPKGFLQIEKKQITLIGKQSELSNCANIIRFSNTIALPAFINAHIHLSYQNKISSKKSLDWIYELICESRAYSPAEKTAIAKQNLKQIYQTGTKVIVENTPFREVIEILASSNIEALIGLEVFGQNEEVFTKYLNQIEQLQAEFGSLNFTFSPHSIYNVGTTLLQKLTEWAITNNKPLLLHLAEFDFEVELTQKGFASDELSHFYKQINFPEPDLRPLMGLSPVEYLQKINCLNSNLCLTHCIKASIADLEILAKNQVKIITCPRSNFYLENGHANLVTMLELGLELCFGTDGLCSNSDLNLLNEIKFVQKQGLKISSKTLFESITSAPARAFGLNNLGSLEINKRAILNCLKLNQEQMQKALSLNENIYTFLLEL